MFYRESGQFKSSYAADSAIFTIAQDRVFIAALLALSLSPFRARPATTCYPASSSPS